MQRLIAQDVVSKRIYKKFGQQALFLFEPAAIKCLESIIMLMSIHYRECDIRLVVNNWYSRELIKNMGVTLEYRGYREPECMIGGRYSQHRLFGAFDIDILVGTVRLDPVIVRKFLIKYQMLLPWIKRIEADKNWTHIDSKSSINIFPTGAAK